jgi:hypothetical protein
MIGNADLIPGVCRGSFGLCKLDLSLLEAVEEFGTTQKHLFTCKSWRSVETIIEMIYG